MKIYPIATIEELKKITGKKIINHQADLQKIINTMPVRLTDHLSKLCKKYPAVAKQFLPDPHELKGIGLKKPWVGILETEIYGLERMYIDRCIIMPFNQCPAYCRFCFRKFYEKRQNIPMTYVQIDRAIKYIKDDTRLKGVLITGGDPLLDLNRLEYIIKKLRKIEHIQDIRIGSRSVMYFPALITDKLIKMLLKYHDLKKGKPIEIATHFNHPNEVTKESIKAITKITKSSIRLYNQAVLLKGINDNPAILINLFRTLRALGVEIYYLFHCIPVEGTQHLRTSIQKGIEIKKYFRSGHATGRINPTYVVATEIGKVEIGVDGYIEKKVGNYVWIKTPYKLKTYQSVYPKIKLPIGEYKIGKDGCISIKYLDGRD